MSLSDYENVITVFDVILGTSNSKLIDQFPIRGRQNSLNLYNLPKFYFDLPKRTLRKNSSKIILFNQTLKVIENIYKDVGGHDMCYDEIKQLYTKSCEEEYICLPFDRSKKKRSRKILFL